MEDIINDIQKLLQKSPCPYPRFNLLVILLSPTTLGIKICTVEVDPDQPTLPGDQNKLNEVITTVLSTSISIFYGIVTNCSHSETILRAKQRPGAWH
jgi:hypothetical protein